MANSIALILGQLRADSAAARAAGIPLSDVLAVLQVDYYGIKPELELTLTISAGPDKQGRVQFAEPIARTPALKDTWFETNLLPLAAPNGFGLTLTEEQIQNICSNAGCDPDGNIAPSFGKYFAGVPGYSVFVSPIVDVPRYEGDIGHGWRQKGGPFDDYQTVRTIGFHARSIMEAAKYLRDHLPIVVVDQGSGGILPI